MPRKGNTTKDSKSKRRRVAKRQAKSNAKSENSSGGRK